MKTFFTIAVLSLLVACGPAKKLVYIDDWQGNYFLKEHNCCGDVQKPVTLVLLKKEPNVYTWYMLQTGERFAEGRAVYEKNKLKFFAEKINTGKRYFVDEVSKDQVLFWMEYDNYYTDQNYRYIGCYTRWRNELVGYEQSNKLFAGVSFHFKKAGAGEIKWNKER